MTRVFEAGVDAYVQIEVRGRRSAPQTYAFVRCDGQTDVFTEDEMRHSDWWRQFPTDEAERIASCLNAIHDRRPSGETAQAAAAAKPRMIPSIKTPITWLDAGWSNTGPERWWPHSDALTLKDADGTAWVVRLTAAIAEGWLDAPTTNPERRDEMRALAEAYVSGGSPVGHFGTGLFGPPQPLRGRD